MTEQEQKAREIHLAARRLSTIHQIKRTFEGFEYDRPAISDEAIDMVAGDMMEFRNEMDQSLKKLTHAISTRMAAINRQIDFRTLASLPFIAMLATYNHLLMDALKVSKETDRAVYNLTLHLAFEDQLVSFLKDSLDAVTETYMNVYEGVTTPAAMREGLGEILAAASKLATALEGDEKDALLLSLLNDMKEKIDAAEPLN